jgi:hypothetical protein
MDRFRDEEPGDTIPVNRGGAKVVPHEVLAAYRELRIDHQLDFAVYKLSPDDASFAGLSLGLLRAVTAWLSGASLVAALVLATMELLFSAPWVTPTALAFAILGVAVRAWRDGLAIEHEWLHYTQMKKRFSEIRMLWEHAATDVHKLDVMRATEGACVEELRSFLRTHEEAQFVL